MRCMGPRMLMFISWSAFARSKEANDRGRCTPALFTRQSTSGWSLVRRCVKVGMESMSPVSRTGELLAGPSYFGSGVEGKHEP
jgi:hypothetical protein